MSCAQRFPPLQQCSFRSYGMAWHGTCRVRGTCVVGLSVSTGPLTPAAYKGHDPAHQEGRYVLRRNPGARCPGLSIVRHYRAVLWLTFYGTVGRVGGQVAALAGRSPSRLARLNPCLNLPPADGHALPQPQSALGQPGSPLPATRQAHALMQACRQAVTAVQCRTAHLAEGRRLVADGRLYGKPVLVQRFDQAACSIAKHR